MSPRSVWVVSWAYWSFSSQSGGGFWWYEEEEDARLAFDEEKRCWANSDARVRLVRLDPPEDAFSCAGHERWIHATGDMRKEFGPCDYDSPVTCWIDSNLDLIECLPHEGGTRAESVWINSAEPSAA